MGGPPIHLHCLTTHRAVVRTPFSFLFEINFFGIQNPAVSVCKLLELQALSDWHSAGYIIRKTLQQFRWSLQETRSLHSNEGQPAYCVLTSHLTCSLKRNTEGGNSICNGLRRQSGHIDFTFNCVICGKDSACWSNNKCPDSQHKASCRLCLSGMVLYRGLKSGFPQRPSHVWVACPQCRAFCLLSLLTWALY